MKKFSIFIALAVVFAITMSLALGCNSYATNKNLEVADIPSDNVPAAQIDQQYIKDIIKKIILKEHEKEKFNKDRVDSASKRISETPTKNTDAAETAGEPETTEPPSEPALPSETPQLAPPPSMTPSTEAETIPPVPETGTPTPTVVETTPETTFPLYYSDETVNVVVDRWWTGFTFAYTAHITLSDYSRAGMYCANNTYGSYCTTSEAASQLNAIVCINGDYNPPDVGYKCARQGVCYNDGPCYAEGIYNSNNGMLFYGGEQSATAGQSLSSLVANGIVTDTMQFGSAFLRDGQLYASQGGNRRPRTFIGTNGKPGDLLLCVADGDLNDGESYGLTAYECAEFLRSHGCIFGVPLDGGGSSTLVFNGTVINAVNGNERAVTDFFFIR